jgi:hypothetical protein
MIQPIKDPQDPNLKKLYMNSKKGFKGGFVGIFLMFNTASSASASTVSEDAGLGLLGL